MDIKKYFKELRFNPAHHIGAGDIRITIGQQEEIEREVSRLRDALESIVRCGDTNSHDIAADTLEAPNDPKLSDCGARRGSCEGVAKKEATDVEKRRARRRRLRA